MSGSCGLSEVRVDTSLGKGGGTDGEREKSKYQEGTWSRIKGKNIEGPSALIDWQYNIHLENRR